MVAESDIMRNRNSQPILVKCFIGAQGEHTRRHGDLVQGYLSIFVNENKALRGLNQRQETQRAAHCGLEGDRDGSFQSVEGGDLVNQCSQAPILIEKRVAFFCLFFHFFI